MIGDEFVTFCRSSKGKALLDECSDALEAARGDLPPVMLALKKNHSEDPALLAQLGTLALARRKARQVIPWASEGFFTLEALEQSSAPEVAAYHAHPFEGLGRVLEIGGGVGLDSIALSKVVTRLTVLEPDLERVALLRANLSLLGIGNVEVIPRTVEELSDSVWNTDVQGVWADPARREGGVRLHDPARYRPSLPWLLSQPLPSIVGIKIGPGAKLEGVNCAGFAKEWIGMRDECREQILWRTARHPEVQVTLVDSQQHFVPEVGGAVSEVVTLGHGTFSYVYEPHAAIIAAGCVAQLFYTLGISRIDPRIAYGVSHSAVVETPWVRGFQVIEHFEYSRKALDSAVRNLKFGVRSVVKKRGLAASSEELHAKIAWDEESDREGLVIMARVGRGHHVFLCEWNG